jgi:hypothetical protein
MAIGMENAYLKLDAATNELAFKYVQPGENQIGMPPNGIIQYYVSKSPKFCYQLKKKNSNINECKEFSRNLLLPYYSLAGSWLLFMVLFFVEKFWLNVRTKAEHNKRMQSDSAEPRR